MANPSLRFLIAAILAACLGGAAQAADEEAQSHFTLRVLPLLKSKCLACHGDDAKKIKGDLDMRSRDGLLKGGESGKPALSPGQPEKSPMFRAVKWDGLEMPPKENDRLTDVQIEQLRRWIAAGAPWPDEAKQKRHRQAEWAIPVTAEGVIVKTSGGLADDWTYRRYKPEDIWAYRAVKKPQIPQANAVNPVDHFIAAGLAAAGRAGAAEADPRTLIRRATFDLIGLPPTPEEIEAFTAAWAKDRSQAWASLIERLLASPHYGERWGQHWLDVARYADTGGMANDFERSNAWRYRDYVIRAFNDDKPYDRFIIEQIAGDELADESARRRLSGDDAQLRKTRLSGEYTDEEVEWIVASSFLRMGPWDNAMVMSPEARQIYRDDLVNAIGQTFLSTTMRCVKCHDHKFDPIPTRDYYRLYAALAGTQMAERPLRYAPGENLQGMEEGKAFVQTMSAYATARKNELINKRETAARQWYKEHGLPYQTEGQRNDQPDDKKPPRNIGLDHVDEGRLKVHEQDEWIWLRSMERYEPMVQGVFNGPDAPYAWNEARRLRMPEKVNLGWKPQSHIFTGGSLEAPGEKVGPGVLSAAGVPVAGAMGDPYAMSEKLEGRRLAMARWIADPRNPLTARSLVNRVFQHHFGKPLAGNPNNFGAKGGKPTHPELLDWLAADFVENGWKIKRLHRLIMNSQAYRMDQLRDQDPNNDLLAYFPTRRLTAEELRDAMLKITGELNPAFGGLPIMPEINMEVALQPRMIQFSLAPAYQPSPRPEQRNRRSIYAYRIRGMTDPFLEAFNLPNSNDSCEIRDAAAVSPQAFTLMNSDLMTDRFIAFALRLEKEARTAEQRVDRAFMLALGRAASEDERKRMVAYIARMEVYHRGVKPAPVKYPTRITRSLVEEFSGQTFEYEEILPVFKSYVPDAKAADVGAETRALADLCSLIFNSNEFIYVY